MDVTSLILWVGAAVIGALVLYLFTMFNDRLRGLPPGPPWIPILGCWDLIGMDGSKFHLWLTDLRDRYGDLATVYMGQKRLVVLNSFDIVKEAFVTKGVQSGARLIDHRVTSINPQYPHKTGIVHSDLNDEWKKQRSTALNILRSLGMGKHNAEYKIQREAAALVTKLYETKQSPTDVEPFFKLTISNFICSLLFGKRYTYDDKDFQSLLENIFQLFEGFAKDPDVQTIPWLAFIKPSYKENIRKLYEAGGSLLKFYDERIEEGKKKIADGEEPTDFVTLYLSEINRIGQGETKISEDWLQQIISDFFTAGSESNATTLRWAMLYMAKNPEVQGKVHQQLDSVVGREQYTFSLSDRTKLPYIEATIMEVQRKGSVAAIGMPHKAASDMQLAGYSIPKGTELWPNFYLVLNDPKTWDSPEKFKPERFLDENGQVRKHDHWVPFSMGPRTCPGDQVARQQLFIIFTQILHTFTITFPAEEPEPSDQGIFTFGLMPGKYHVCFKPRL